MIIGHVKNKKYFKNLISGGSLSHSYLFTGPDMVGKKSFAFELCEMINGRNGENDPDFILIRPNTEEGESKIYIEDIRKLKTFFSMKPYAGPYKIAVIDDAHRLTPESANGLLKLLEEPTAHSVIFLVTSLSKMMPATVISRCETVKFSPLKESEISEWLSGKKVKKEDKDFLVKLAGGRIGLIENLIEQKGVAEAHKAIDDLRKLLGAGIFERMDFAKKIHEKDKYQPMVAYWLDWVAAHVTSSPKNEKIVKDLLALNAVISQPQYNRRLALENFLLNL